MEPTSQQRALDVLEASLDLPEAERQLLLAEASAADPRVGKELRRLETVRTSASLLLPTDVGAGKELPAAPPPEQIGVYRLMRLVGRGGMGAVYEGIRSDGLFDQRVAIKLLASRRWSTELEQRFVTERRVLARLEHRNIARIYDGGVTTDGHSFIVMEYIDGRPITEFADAQRLGLRARVSLVSQLCGALQFAHQQLVVHADIKPSNVLVTRDGSVKLLDFGIAQLLDLKAADPAGSSSGSREPLTAAYAAPERAAGGAASVLGDVFSLGVVLRELLAGHGAAAASSHELQCIAEKATAVDPAARYGSVAALGDDLANWLRQLPVSAVRPSWRYVAGLFIARHRPSVVIAVGTVLGLIAATIVSTRLYLAAERARNAETQRFAEVRELNSYLVSDVSDQMFERPGMIEAHLRTLDDARSRLERLASSRPEDARLQIDLGSDILRVAYSALMAAAPDRGNVQQVRNDLANAGKRLEHLAGTAAELPGYWEARAEIAAIQSGLFVTLDGDAAQARSQAQVAIGLADEAMRRHPNSAETLNASLNARLALAAALNGGGSPNEAITVLDLALHEIGSAARNASLSAPQLSNAIVTAEFRRCDYKRWLYADQRALTDCAMVERKLRENIRAQGPLVTQEKMLAYTLFLMASVLSEPADATRALAMLDEASDIYSRILYFGVNDELSAYQLVVAAARANALANLGRFAEARSTARDLLQRRRVRLADQPGSHSRQREVATALRRVGEVELLAGRAGAACSAFAEAGAIWDDMQRRGTLLGFDLAPPSGQVPWIRQQLARCKGS